MTDSSVESFLPLNSGESGVNEIYMIYLVMTLLYNKVSRKVYNHSTSRQIFISVLPDFKTFFSTCKAHPKQTGTKHDRLRFTLPHHIITLAHIGLYTFEGRKAPFNHYCPMDIIINKS